MIDRQHGKILIECDSCPEVFDAESPIWNVVWHAAKRDGWTAEKIGDDQWVHSCRRCTGLKK
jgi:hypothetical protein